MFVSELLSAILTLEQVAMMLRLKGRFNFTPYGAFHYASIVQKGLACTNSGQNTVF